MTTETSQALEFFEQATECFKKALQEVRLVSHPPAHLAWMRLNCYIFLLQHFKHSMVPVLQEPTNDVYKKALEMTHQAPQLHAELQKQIHANQVCASVLCQFNSDQM